MDKTQFDPDDSLGYLVNRAGRSLAHRLAHNFAEDGHDVTAEQWAILLRLWEHDGQSQQQLAAGTCKDKTSITRLLDGLERRNLVVRTPDRIDRRQKLIFLTAKGRGLRAELVPLAYKTLDEAQEGIERGHLDICKQVLRVVYENLADTFTES